MSASDRIDDYADADAAARRRLPKAMYENIFPAHAGRGITARDNVGAFDDVRFRPRAAVAFAERDLNTTVLGIPVSMPLLIAPVGNLRLVHPDGAKAAVRAAGAAKTIGVVSMSAGHSTPEVAAAASGPVWQQLYLSHGREKAERVIAEAKAARFGALMVTVDCPTRPRKKLDLSVSLRTAIEFGPQLALKPRWTAGFLRDGAQLAAAREALGAESGEPIVWGDLGWIRDLWGGPLVVKGIVTADDARRAVDAGASAIVVSNHGGLVLDGAPASIRALPEVVDAVDGQVEVLLDSGVRQGSDVVKAIGLGARAVLIGRAYIAGLAAYGEAGVLRMLEVFRSDIDRTLAMLGCPSIEALDASFVTAPTAHMSRE
jgi:isopentenyl diphosphate isomerase/L-lactate dehydrogenase-like FMN-dependent dehydrogenase